MTEISTDGTAPTWQVIAQVERTILGVTGQATEVMAVTFQLANGTQATVNVPLVSYPPANVRAAIAAKAQAVAAVDQLTG
jgi:hypothetical protein